jgi:mRNA interferase MazF
VICDFGDVAIVPFPFTEQAVTKYRPALVLSSERFNEENQNTVMAMITTAKESSWPSDLVIQDPEGAGLVRSCVIRWKVFTLPNGLLDRKAGRLASKDRKAAKTALAGLFG